MSTTYNQQKKDDHKRWAKFAFMTAAVAIGTYYGAGRYIKVTSKQIELVNANINSLGQFLADQSDNKEAFMQAQRSAITAARLAGTGFTYYPGLGVLHHEPSN